ncbi:hypothetical protein [Conexibacter arvalis]|uniref:hypothetical protein n=1 Tax=Conexibacter arvalis TaxID=912552 RepID=UPI00160CC8C5|nr:hypothetical protein [Conexibacter arvalis]
MAIVAVLAAVLTLAAPLVARAIIGTDPTDNALTRALVQADNRGAILLSAALSVLGLLGITFVLDFLLRGARARDTSIQPYVRILLLVGGIGLALFTGVIQAITSLRLEHWATEGTQTWEELRDASNYGPYVFFGIAAQLAFAFAFVLVSLNAMRVGLLTRFLGYLGVISAVLFVLAVLPLPIVQAYWLAMIGLLLWNVRGPREPPAWQLGEAVPWPSSAELREQRVRAAEARRGGGEREPEPVGAGDDAEADAGARPVPASARKKRKKRR